MRYKLTTDAVEAMQIPPKEKWTSDESLAGRIHTFINAPARACQVSLSPTEFRVRIWLNTKGCQFVSPNAGEWLVKLPDPFYGVRLVVVADELFGNLFVSESQTPKPAPRCSDPAEQDWGGGGWHQGGTGNYPARATYDWFEQRDL